MTKPNTVFEALLKTYRTQAANEAHGITVTQQLKVLGIDTEDLVEVLEKFDNDKLVTSGQAFLAGLSVGQLMSSEKKANGKT